MLDIDGFYRPIEDFGDMIAPVECQYCFKVYDLAAVKVIQRYTDCSVFMTPCCNKQADDRTFVSLPAIRKLR